MFTSEDAGRDGSPWVTSTGKCASAFHLAQICLTQPPAYNLSISNPPVWYIRFSHYAVQPIHLFAELDGIKYLIARTSESNSRRERLFSDDGAWSGKANLNKITLYEVGVRGKYDRIGSFVNWFNSAAAAYGKLEDKLDPQAREAHSDLHYISHALRNWLQKGVIKERRSKETLLLTTTLTAALRDFEEKKPDPRKPNDFPDWIFRMTEADRAAENSTITPKRRSLPPVRSKPLDVARMDALPSKRITLARRPTNIEAVPFPSPLGRHPTTLGNVSAPVPPQRIRECYKISQINLGNLQHPLLGLFSFKRVHSQRHHEDVGGGASPTPRTPHAGPE